MIQIYLFYLFLIIWHLIWYLQEGQWHVHVASRGPWVFLLVVCDLCWTCRQAKLRRGVTWTEISNSSRLWHDFFMCILMFQKEHFPGQKILTPKSHHEFQDKRHLPKLVSCKFQLRPSSHLRLFWFPPLSSLTIHPFPTFQDRLLQHPWFFSTPAQWSRIGAFDPKKCREWGQEWIWLNIVIVGTSAPRLGGDLWLQMWRKVKGRFFFCLSHSKVTAKPDFSGKESHRTALAMRTCSADPDHLNRGHRSGVFHFVISPSLLWVKHNHFHFLPWKQKHSATSKEFVVLIASSQGWLTMNNSI